MAKALDNCGGLGRVSKNCNHAITWWGKIFFNQHKFRSNERKTGRRKKYTKFKYLSQFDKVFLVLHVLMAFLLHVSAPNYQSKDFDCAKEFAFRKSGLGWLWLISIYAGGHVLLLLVHSLTSLKTVSFIKANKLLREIQAWTLESPLLQADEPTVTQTWINLCETDCLVGMAKKSHWAKVENKMILVKGIFSTK